MPIAAVLTVTLILSVSFFVFSTSLISNPSVPIMPLAEVSGSTGPALLWNFTTNQDSVFSPVVANGFVYVTSENKFGSAITLFCLNASTGTQAWNTTGTFLNFVVANGYVYISQAVEAQPPSQGISILHGAISCLNAYSGSQLWNYSYRTQLGAPIVGGGIVYVDGTNFALALNALTGAEIWNYSAPAGTSFNSFVLADANLYAISASLSIANASYHSVVYALDASSGKNLWNYTAPGQFNSLVAADQNVYVGSNFADTTGNTLFENASGSIYQGGVLALDASNGTRIWNYSINSSVGSPIVSKGMVYAVSSNAGIYALDASNGRVIWKYSSKLGLGSNLLVNGYFYVGSPAGVYCFNAYNGRVIWKFVASNFAGSAATSPAYADGVIYVGWSDPGLFSLVTQHSFYALNAANGKELWSYPLGYTVISSPTAYNGTVYIDASFVNPLRDELDEGPGAVIAVKSNVTSLPLPTLPISEPTLSPLTTTAGAILVAVVVAIIISSVAYTFGKRLKTRKANTSLPSDLPSKALFTQKKEGDQNTFH